MLPAATAAVTVSAIDVGDGEERPLCRNGSSCDGPTATHRPWWPWSTYLTAPAAALLPTADRRAASLPLSGDRRGGYPAPRRRRPWLPGPCPRRRPTRWMSASTLAAARTAAPLLHRRDRDRLAAGAAAVRAYAVVCRRVACAVRCDRGLAAWGMGGGGETETGGRGEEEKRNRV
uniref:Uncharacterized protein n=1 Tax=Oryza sativa subsp. japonica TaxID=39947 RepID=Q5VSA5_ORYSJ|nr:hypothetical protein [Oryza sativa Japonica Group]